MNRYTVKSFSPTLLLPPSSHPNPLIGRDNFILIFLCIFLVFLQANISNSYISSLPSLYTRSGIFYSLICILHFPLTMCLGDLSYQYQESFLMLSNSSIASHCRICHGWFDYSPTDEPLGCF